MNRNCVPIISSRYLLRTFAVPTKYQLNYMFGIRFKAKPEHVAAKVRRWYGVGVGMVYADGGGGRLGCDAVFWGATRHAASLQTPPLIVGIAGRVMRRMRHRPSFALTGASTGTANGGSTTRHAASLRPPRKGRIGFKPPYSKRGPAAKSGRYAGWHDMRMEASGRLIINGNGIEGDHDAARRVATPSEKLENRF